MAFIFLAAIAVRVFLIVTTEVVSRDGVTFVKYARALSGDPITEMRRQAQHPLYPVTILITHSLVGPLLARDSVFGWPIAGQIASLMGGLLAIGAAYALGAFMWNRRIGVITALFTAMLPPLVQVSSDALSDALHLGLYLWGLVAVLQGLQSGRLRWLGLGAVCSGLAFLTRPEGGSVVVIGVVMMALASRKQGWTWRWRLAGAATLILVFGAVSGPYMLTVGKVVKKKSVLELFNLIEPGEASARVEPATSLAEREASWCSVHAGTALVLIPFELLYQWGRCCRVVYLLLALPALTLRLVPHPRGLVPIMLAWMLHMCLLAGLLTSFGYLSLRHLIVPTALVLPFSAATFAWLVDRGAVALAYRRHTRARRMRPTVYAIGVLLTVAPTLPWMLRTIGGGDNYLIAAGRWLHEHSTPDETVLTTRCRVAYYAELKTLPAPDTGSIEHLAGYVRKLNPTYVVVEENHETDPGRNPQFFADLKASPLRKSLKLIHEEPGDRGKVLIYRVNLGPLQERLGR